MTFRNSERRVVLVAERLLFPDPEFRVTRRLTGSRARDVEKWDPDGRVIGILWFLEWYNDFGIEVTTLLGSDEADAIEARMDALHIPGTVTYVDNFSTLAQYALSPEVHGVWHNLDWDAHNHPKVIRLEDPDLFDLYEGYK